MRGMDHDREIERLFQVEYGERHELTFRFGAVAIAGILLYLYSGWVSSWVWLIGYFLLQLTYFRFLRSRRPGCTSRDTRIAACIFLVMLAEFVSVPALLAVQDDPAMRVGGTAVIGTILVFLVRRSDTMKPMVWGQIAIIGLLVAGIVGHTMTEVDSTLAEVAVVISGVGLLVYLAQATLIVRKQRIQAEVAAERSAQAQKLEAIGQLAGGVAHDFNNILTAVLGNLELYREVCAGPERDAFVENAHKAAKRAEQVVEQLLVYSRQSKGTATSHEANALLGDVVVLGRRLLPASTDMQVFPADRDLWVQVDENQLLTALINLIVNAVDAMEGGGRLTLSVSLRQYGAPQPMIDGTTIPAGAYAELKVADTGPGIPRELLDRVVEPFFTTKPVGKGSGLGLAMVLGFAQKSEGGLKIETSGAGTAISLLLPLRDEPDRAIVGSGKTDSRVPGASNGAFQAPETP